MADNSHNSEKTDAGLENFLTEIWKYQMEFFKGVSIPTPSSSKEFSKLYEKHWKRVEEKTKELPPDLWDAKNLQIQKDLYIYCMQSYSQMIQEFLMSPTFLYTMKESLGNNLNRKIQMDEAKEEILKSWGMPTRKDIHEIYYNLYLINKKLDKISETIEGGE
ncbi:MAG: hypothetical protein HZB92_04045 [Euryarchaeota archaeon]|nr:hypothetical protein [Euryarchaeota archaeon]